MRLIPLAILCALVGVTYWIGATFYTAKIEQDIATRTNTAIEPYKPAVDLEVDGRDVTLVGRVRDEKSREEALQTVDSVYGVRATRDSLSIMQPFNIHAKYDNGKDFIVDGTVDDQQALESLKRTIAPRNAIANLDKGARPLINSGAKIALAAGAVGMMNHGEFWIDEDRLKITGEAADEFTKAQIEQHLNRQKAVIDPLDLVTQISVAAVKVSSNCLNFSSAGNINEVVLFDVDSDFIKDTYKEPIARLVDLVKECAANSEGNIIVEAHADQDGSEDYNFALSQRRADEVTNYLLMQGLDAKHIASFAFGETRPVASNESRTDKSFNRRVEVRYLKDSQESNSLNQTIISTQSSE